MAKSTCQLPEKLLKIQLQRPEKDLSVSVHHGHQVVLKLLEAICIIRD